MLQQVQLKTVISYFTLWLIGLSNFNAVAYAGLNYIIKKWEGLGYFARLKNFHSACSIVMKHHNGTVLYNSKNFLSLPGLDAYIAGSVMSTGYNGY